ncbi:unnamed protein product [Rangifer tarandus platyrhynchus]|uniref:Uncharacterized protein n=1 Tax=Rangifer tarandus platyrhynchus TaxID=3082113 RepID=A0ABN8XPU2_RANTA|nr:unnamed protein product [Rangifer tarandus platyrhynchus]
MRRKLTDTQRTYHNRLWTDLPQVCAFSVFLLLFDTMLYETLFFPSEWGFVLFCYLVGRGFLHPDFNLNMNGLALWLVHLLPPSASTHLSYALTVLTFPLLILVPHEKVPESPPVFHLNV